MHACLLVCVGFYARVVFHTHFSMLTSVGCFLFCCLSPSLLRDQSWPFFFHHSRLRFFNLLLLHNHSVHHVKWSALGRALIYRNHTKKKQSGTALWLPVPIKPSNPSLHKKQTLNNSGDDQGLPLLLVYPNPCYFWIILNASITNFAFFSIMDGIGPEKAHFHFYSKMWSILAWPPSFDLSRGLHFTSKAPRVVEVHKPSQCNKDLILWLTYWMGYHKLGLIWS